jgi:hypothetical protein
MNFRLVALAALLPAAVLAQQPAQPADPADPKAAVPAMRYQSAVAGYRSFKQDKPAPWKQVNEDVKGAAGHATHGAPKSRAPGEAPSKAEPRPATPAEHKH